MSKKEEEICDKLLSGEWIGMPNWSSHPISQRGFKSVHLFPYDESTSQNCQDCHFTFLDLYRAKELPQVHSTESNWFDRSSTLIRSKFQSRLMGRIFVRIEQEHKGGIRKRKSANSLFHFSKLLITVLFDHKKKNERRKLLTYTFSVSHYYNVSYIFHWLYHKELNFVNSGIVELKFTKWGSYLNHIIFNLILKELITFV